MKARLIVNPRSGTDSAPDALERINRELRKRPGRLEIVMTVTEGDANRCAFDLMPRAATFLGYREEQRFDSSNRGHYSRNYC